MLHATRKVPFGSLSPEGEHSMLAKLPQVEEEEDDSIWIDSASSSAGSASGAWMIGFGCGSASAAFAAAAAAAVGGPGLLGAAASRDESDELDDMLQLLGVWSGCCGG
jgi:hypothetical protein